MSYETFEKWEDDAQTNYERMFEFEQIAGFSSRYERDRIENIGHLNPNKSIEADAGDYYIRRQRALNKLLTFYRIYGKI